MRKLLFVLLLLNVVAIAFTTRGRFVAAGGQILAKQNGDCNGDGVRDLSDAIHLLAWMFQGGPDPVAFAESEESQARIAALERSVSTLLARVASLEGATGLTADEKRVLGHLSVVQLDDGGGRALETIRISGANLQIVNGLGATNGNPADPHSLSAEVNGLGNLIVGYQEVLGSTATDRSGSHNLVVGSNHNYSSFGGVVIGRHHDLRGAYSSITGGISNAAIGPYSSVNGGGENVARGPGAVVSGGITNSAEAFYSSISGGMNNVVQGEGSSISGGVFNKATGDASSVSGGEGNIASGRRASISGGLLNTAEDSYSAAP